MNPPYLLLCNSALTETGNIYQQFSLRIFNFTWITFVCQSLVMWKPRRSNKRLHTPWPGRPPILKIIIPMGFMTAIPSSTARAIKPKPNWSSTKPWIHWTKQDSVSIWKHLAMWQEKCSLQFENSQLCSWILLININ